MTKIVHIETDKGEMVAEMYEKDAPGTVENFVGLVTGSKEWTNPKTGAKEKKPFYDGLSFHRVIDDFMIQGGCPLGTGTGGPGYKIKCETAGNPRKNERGTLSMAHAGKDTGGSQFFINHKHNTHLDGKHTVFGKLTKGLEVLDSIRMGDRMKRVWVEEK